MPARDFTHVHQHGPVDSGRAATHLEEPRRVVTQVAKSTGMHPGASHCPKQWEGRPAGSGNLLKNSRGRGARGETTILRRPSGKSLHASEVEDRPAPSPLGPLAQLVRAHG
jgi:hypothetical protein